MSVIDVYVGFDRRNDGQQLAYEICEKSILQNTAAPDRVRIHQLHLGKLRDAGLYWREEDPLAATEFTYTRFLTPYLNKYEGRAVFCDSDFLWECDLVAELTPYFEQMERENLALMCVQHDYTPSEKTKMDGRAQTVYPRKNWSSMILFNASHPEVANLTLERVNTETPKYLHRFEWCDDRYLGAVPHTYNYLVGVYSDQDQPKVIHYTDGGPWHYLYREAEFTDRWLPYLDNSQRERLAAELERQRLELETA